MSTFFGIPQSCESRVVTQPYLSAVLQKQLDDLLTEIMTDIHDKCRKAGECDDGSVDYRRGANIAGFEKVADAMLAYGVM